ncbi:helix-turn-helix domain-containing protein [Methylobacterium oryzihabitans]|uniref:helix-turn-helix domain-containing protein n=1 Tax=Methylobacterium oryzihabitans TaxID=2499852 RepID=UPI001FED084B|nr:helix-turn-helix transcriptional regulator [Methylobacterium oryzihabitans]
MTSTLLANPVSLPIEPSLGCLLSSPADGCGRGTPSVASSDGGPGGRHPGRAIRGRHIRAARGLLDWSMHDLAHASGLSLSTIRRLENDEVVPETSRSHGTAVAALRRAGIEFALVHHTVAIYCV